MKPNKKRQRTVDYFMGQTKPFFTEKIKRDLEIKQAFKHQNNFRSLLKSGMIAEVRSENELETLLV